MTERVFATYHIETAFPLEKAAAAMAGEQSSGTFVEIPGETADLVTRHGAQVVSIRAMGEVDSHSLPGARRPKKDSQARIRQAEVVLSFPYENIGPSLPNLLTMVAGNLYELNQFSGLRLIDIQIPQPFAEVYPGPQFGVPGTRALSAVFERPIIGTIIKPSVGLSPADTAVLVQSLAEAGLDFVKDDELIANPPYSPLAERVTAVMAVVNRHADKTGKKLMIAFNITGEIDEMRRHHDVVLAAGGTCVMVSINSVGLAGVSALRRHSQLPIHAHRNGWGIFSRHPFLGMAFSAYHKLWRLAGVDHMHVNGIRNKFCEQDESVITSTRACREPLLGGYTVMPVFSSGQWAEQAPDTYKAIGHVDLIYLCGGGIMAHPGGAVAGVLSVRQAWEAALAGRSLQTYAETHLELRQAIERFGNL